MANWDSTGLIEGGHGDSAEEASAGDGVFLESGV